MFWSQTLASVSTVFKFTATTTTSKTTSSKNDDDDRDDYRTREVSSGDENERKQTGLVESEEYS